MMFSHFSRMITNLPYDPKKRPRYMLSNPNAFMFTLQIKFSVDLGQRRLGKSWWTSCGAVVLLRRCKNCRGTILSNLIYFFSLLVHLLDAPIKDVPTFFRTFTLHEPLRLFIPEGNENDDVRISSFSITPPTEGNYTGRIKKGWIHQRCVLVFLP